MIEEAEGKQSGLKNSYRMKVEPKKPKNDVVFDDIVKFLIYQKDVMDYADLN